MVEKIKKHKRNSYIRFEEESHRYFYTCDDRNEEFEGITSLIGKYTAPFDSDKISKFIAYRDGVDQEDVLEDWSKARGYGKFVDKVIGDYINDGKTTNTPEVDHFIKAMEEKELTPLVSEWVVYDEELKRASAIDVVCLNKKGELVIVDLKSMEKPISITAYKDKKMSYPISSLPDSKYYKQSLQVGFYKYWIEKDYNLPVSNERYVLRIRPDFYEWVPLMDVETEIKKIYDFERKN